MPRRLIHRISAAASRLSREGVRSAPSHLEPLEPRILFSAHGPPMIQDIVADNRGLITMEVSRELDSDTLNETSVQVFTAGADNLFGTFDDVIEARDVSYDAATGVLTIQADITADTRYGVRLDATIVRGVNGSLLDGEFNGAGLPSGDGQTGGDLLFYTKTAPTQIARMTTSLGTIDFELFTAETPISVANFLNYVNSGRYDETIVHRSVMNFIWQGGGFSNELGFDRIDVDPTIQNEPGISNLRGTIAFAKLGNDPNSASSQWFFNLGDNSANLDQQNGGFTVFGEIVDQSGLDIMDLIASQQTVDASGIQGAFTDLPVTDVDALNGNPGAVTPALTVSIDRVAVLQDLSATPPEQIQADSFVYLSNRDVFVTVYDLGGIGRDELDRALDVKFSGNRVSSITVVGDLPAGSLGIVIGDANRVGTIKDAGADSSIAFIFSNAPVGKMTLKGDITGYNLNGLNLGGVLLADDIDGDGAFSDETAILINAGQVNSLNSTGAIAGDILIPGGLAGLTLRGEVSNSQIRIGAAPDSATILNARIDNAANTDLDSETPIKSLRVNNWTASGDNGLLSAPSIANLRLGGAFDVDVTLSGAAESGSPALGKLIARSGLVRATFEVNGDIGPISVKGDTANATINATGAIASIKLGDVINTSFSTSSADLMRSIKLGRVTESDFRIAGDVKTATARSWDGGLLSASTIRTIKVTDPNAEFTSDITLLGTGVTSGYVSRNIQINSMITGGTWSVNGDAKVVKIRDIVDADLSFIRSVDKLTMGEVGRIHLTIQGAVNSMTTGTWTRGEFDVTAINRFMVNGDFRADINATRANLISVTGDVFRSDLFFSQQPDQFGTYSLRTLNIGGEMRDVELRASFRVGTIQAKGMDNSIIGVSDSIPNNGFPLPSDIDNFSSIESVTISGPRNGVENFADSYIVASRIGSVVLGEVDSANRGQDFGVGANLLGSISYFADGESVTLRNSDLDASPEPFGDFEIRIRFLRFDGSGA